ncbi:type 1 glutamine amidotransferase domain-containing protein [Pelagicoccus sp. SDUM812002]|uniref:type 1 glutamine amidotransferase domain-containing protein n=1 Tax=Pelagicoccus sp. SDUM812002 TaxID=3041266 RepID=UPI00280DAAAB|nr:type 1 glutamine amidotransferase domain-containing protein [Pelagicoccus sp. SDUM812002]MDQ8186215.1 type 1 glutamine amidotransferase [Pelagicoccus sp. SDUM812002]
MVELSGVKVAILVADGFEQVELVEPKSALEKAGAKTEILSLEEGEVQGVNHDEKADRFPVDKVLSGASEASYAALLLPGGVLNPDTLRGQPEALNFARQFFKNDKPVYAICHGPQLLISANLVKGRRMTAYHTLEADLKNAGAQWVDDSVVVDGNLITSRNPDDLPDFCRAIVEHLAECMSAYR